MGAARANERLREAFHFDAGELAENAMGRLSAAQDTRLRRARRGGSLVLVLAIGSILASIAWQTARSQPQALAPAWLLAIAALVALGVYLPSRQSLAALQGRQIEVAEGVAARPEAGDWIRIGATLLPLAPGLAAAFEPGRPYRVFYLRGPRALVVSAEALGDVGSGAPPRR